MSEAKFTPGPWCVEDPISGELSVVESGKQCYEWRFIATIITEDADFSPKETEANARLIAAAPELYEACKAAVRILERGPGPHVLLLERLRTAIAQAEGRS